MASTLNNYSFSAVEILDANGNNSFTGTAAQLSSFVTLTDSVQPANTQFSVALQGAGGTLDLSTRITGQHSGPLSTTTA